MLIPWVTSTFWIDFLTTRSKLLSPLLPIGNVDVETICVLSHVVVRELVEGARAFLAAVQWSRERALSSSFVTVVGIFLVDADLRPFRSPCATDEPAHIDSILGLSIQVLNSEYASFFYIWEKVHCHGTSHSDMGHH